MEVHSLEEFLKHRDDPSPKVRVGLAREICEQFNDHSFKDDELSIVEDILLLLAQDVEAEVRRMLSEQLKQNPDLPRETALHLAHDVADVSLPVLEFSTVLTENDLVEIVHSAKEAAKHVAIANRDFVPLRVSDALVDTENDVVVTTLLENRNARIGEFSMEKVLDTFKENDRVLHTLVDRGGLSVTLAERMASFVSGQVKQQLVRHYGLPEKTASKAMQDTQENITLDIAESAKQDTLLHKAPCAKTIELVETLHASKKLTYSIVLKALCRGDIRFFEAGLAKLAGIPLANARKLIYDGKNHGFEALYRATDLPENMFNATETIFRLASEEGEHHEEPALFSARMVERILALGYDKSVPNMQYLITLLHNRH